MSQKDTTQTDPSNDSALRNHVVELLRGSHAHVDFAGAIRDVPEGLRGARPDGIDHSLWELLEHIRLAQADILNFSRDSSHVSPPWPEGYWPSSVEPADGEAWDRSVAAVEADMEAMEKLVSDPKSDLFEPFEHGDGQTLLREAMLAADHNAYHVGQIVTV